MAGVLRVKSDQKGRIKESFVEEEASQVVLVVKNPPANNAGGIRDVGSIPGLGRSPGGGHGKPLQYFCLENPHGQREEPERGL